MADIIPQQTSGMGKDNRAQIELAEPSQARQQYEVARARLLDVNHWGDMSGFLSASFQLVDQDGRQVKNRLPMPGDYFKIKIPAPAPLNEYDWVQVERVEEINEPDKDRQITAIRVRPASDPSQRTTETEHFFSPEATSSFIVEREGNRVSAEVHGRNEKPNTKDVDDLRSELRNTIGATGALLGLSDIQWNKLVKGILQSRR
jgi:hypothetical protein